MNTSPPHPALERVDEDDSGRARAQFIALAIVRASSKLAARDRLAIAFKAATDAAAEWDRRESRQRRNGIKTVSIDTLLDEPAQESFVQALIDREHADIRIAKLLARLPDRERTVVERYGFQGETLQAVAKHLGVSTTRARQLYLAAVKRLGGANFTCRGDRWSYPLEKSSARCLFS